MGILNVDETFAGIYARLSGFSQLTNIVNSRIYSRVPNEPTFPYVRFALSGSSLEDDKLNSRNLFDLTVQGFSRKSSPKECSDITEAIFSALHRQETNITISGSTVVRCHRVDFDVLQEPDLVSWQGRVTFDLLVE